jgi:hypothetical protein
MTRKIFRAYIAEERKEEGELILEWTEVFKVKKNYPAILKNFKIQGYCCTCKPGNSQR